MPFYNSINNPSNFSISFSKNPRNDFGIFAKGYFKSAESLKETLLSQNQFSDYEAYPIVFLYRHSFELYLKNIIYSTILLSTFKGLSEIDLKLYNFHTLKPLAEKATKILKTLFANDRDLINFSKKIVKVAKEFDEIDPDSYSYRYPINTKGEYSTKPNQIVNLESFSSELGELLTNLGVIDFGIDIETSQAQTLYEILESIKNDETN